MQIQGLKHQAQRLIQQNGSVVIRRTPEGKMEHSYELIEVVR